MTFATAADADKLKSAHTPPETPGNILSWYAGLLEPEHQ